MLTALTRQVSGAMNECQLTYAERQSINIEKAQLQHRNYEKYLESIGIKVISLDTDPSLPDCTFVEDTAIVTDEIAVITHMGAASRRAEAEKIVSVLEKFRPLKFINNSGTIEGGDVIKVGRVLYVGVSSRTNLDGIDQLSRLLSPYDYEIVPVKVHGCLHLSTGATFLGNQTFLVNPKWIDTSEFKKFDIIPVEENEPWAGNTLNLKGKILLPESSLKTAEKISKKGFEVATVDISELEKAEAGLTCMCVLFES